MRIPIWRTASKLQIPPVYGRCPYLADFHSTPSSFAKWKGKFDYGKDEVKGGQQPKNYAKYVVRRKRADTKRALNDYLLKGFVNSRSSTIREDWATWDDVDSKRTTNAKEEDFSDAFFRDRTQINNSSRCKRYSQQKHSPKNRKSGKKKWSFVSDDDDRDYAKTFEVNFGDKCYSWSFRSSDGSFRSSNGSGFRSSSTAGFEWRDNSSWTSDGSGPWANKQKEQTWNSTNYRKRTWDCESDSEGDYDSDNNDNNTLRNTVSCSHRIMLGLPPTGALQMDAIKTAFRACALKWHPDKHEGASQAMASEKFKSCVEAYKSLSAALGAT